MKPDELSTLRGLPSDIKLKDILFPRSLVSIKLLSGQTVFDEFFTSKRIETMLRYPLELIKKQTTQSLTVEFVNDRVQLLKSKFTSKPSIAACRQLCVAERVLSQLALGAASVTNAEVRAYLEKMSVQAKNGYQISSHSIEIEKLFNGVIIVEKSSIGVNLTWDI